MASDNPHIIRDFEQSIRKLRGEVVLMAGQTRLNLERAMAGLLERNADTCRAVIADDSDVDDSERTIDGLGMDIMVRFHPVATDLRLVISSMKVAANLERISDHAVNIAKRGKKMAARSETPEAKLMEPVYSAADALFRDAMAAFTDSDAGLGASLKERDRELDRLHKRVVENLSGMLEEGGEKTEDYLHLIFVARSLERIGDLSVNIGEDAVFLDAALDIRYNRQQAAEVAAAGSDEG